MQNYKYPGFPFIFCKGAYLSHLFKLRRKCLYFYSLISDVMIKKKQLPIIKRVSPVKLKVRNSLNKKDFHIGFVAVFKFFVIFRLNKIFVKIDKVSVENFFKDIFSFLLCSPREFYDLCDPVLSTMGMSQSRTQFVV